jgi:hypothetical protein
MMKNKNVLFAFAVIILMLSATFVVAIADGNMKSADRTAARTEADLTADYILAVTVQGDPVQLAGQRPNWQLAVSTGAVVNFSLTATSGSPLTLAQMNITWRMQTDLSTTIFAYGANVSFIWSVEASRPISVTFANATNASDVGRQYISLQVSADFDGDGIPDLWERKYFGNLGTADDNQTDFDNDGEMDGAEYYAGHDPTNPNDMPTFFDQYGMIIFAVLIIAVVLLLVVFVMMPKMKTKREAEEKKKIAAAVDVEKSLMGLDDLDEKPKK